MRNASYGPDGRFAGPGGPRRRGRLSLPDSPLVAGITAAVTLALAAVLFLAALPGEERVLYYEGEQVAPSALCETEDEAGETVLGACAELGEWETRETGWGVVQLVIAGVLAAGGAVVAFGIPKQLRERREEELRDLERLTDEDHRRL
ncbi:hypothetical protein GCM10009830_17490 [Glycomyces endophyticus]|uniref:Uncharacterized protein n=1 Tax=Glycomyces endophyticus TaxID=480996 RepID=A0ABP4SGU4_9ACTN